MPLLWKVDDALLALDRLPAFARNLALNASKRSLKNLDLKSNALTVGGRRPLGRRRRPWPT